MARSPKLWFTAPTNLTAIVALLCATFFGAQRLEAGTIVRFDTTLGAFDVELFDNVAPITVANFLSYVHNDRYDGTMIHRVDTGLGVIQGGGYNSQAQLIPSLPLIPLEYSLPNARGTLAMARYYDAMNPSNTATANSQWFINTKDNSNILGPMNNGGYAVFGQVLGNGMDVVDALMAIPTYQYASPFGQVPLINFSLQQQQSGADPYPHIVLVNSISVVPEPSTAVLLVGGSFGLAGAMLRRRRRATTSESRCRLA